MPFKIDELISELKNDDEETINSATNSNRKVKGPWNGKLTSVMSY